ncbi:hypothetical protein PVAND_015265 [Polypedilum vanderplanki]|uniref:Uncharacterized protein n=1 Tax=Polypedilum vanderplanki TaxID=319348 RepID=A0A9J6BC97_POLVA|nr:hypothetical protein PVAND_015265 [Polypedilum vanderplanki]
MGNKVVSILILLQLFFVSINQSSTTTLNCHFNERHYNFTNEKLYTCSAEKNQWQNYSIEITKISGQHQNHLTNNNVKSFSVWNLQNVNFLPKNLSQFFPNVILIQAQNSNIKGIFKEHLAGLQKLKILILSDNQIQGIKAGTFDENENLEMIFLENNLIKQIDGKSFDNLRKLKKLHLSRNSCQNLTNAENKTQVEKLENLIRNKICYESAFQNSYKNIKNLEDIIDKNKEELEKHKTIMTEIFLCIQGVFGLFVITLIILIIIIAVLFKNCQTQTEMTEPLINDESVAFYGSINDDNQQTQISQPSTSNHHEELINILDVINENKKIRALGHRRHSSLIDVEGDGDILASRKIRNEFVNARRPNIPLTRALSSLSSKNAEEFNENDENADANENDENKIEILENSKFNKLNQNLDKSAKKIDVNGSQNSTNDKNHDQNENLKHSIKKLDKNTENFREEIEEKPSKSLNIEQPNQEDSSTVKVGSLPKIDEDCEEFPKDAETLSQKYQRNPQNEKDSTLMSILLKEIKEKQKQKRLGSIYSSKIDEAEEEEEK